MWLSFVLCWGQLRSCLRNLEVSNTIFLTVLTTLHIRSPGILKTGFWTDTCLIIWVLLNHRITFLSGLVFTSTRKECSFVTSRLLVYNSDLHGLDIKSFAWTWYQILQHKVWMPISYASPTFQSPCQFLLNRFGYIISQCLMIVVLLFCEPIYWHSRQ